MKSSLLVLLVVFPAACGGSGSAADAGVEDADTFVPSPRGPFPKGFLWGSATAPYQVEGDLHRTDWYQWEDRCSTCSGDSADDGPDFLTHFVGDFANAASLSNNAIRLGIDWSRLFPTRQQFESLTPDADALARYHEMVDAARDAGLNVMVTLIHFALPTWLHDLDELDNKQGWLDPTIIVDVEAWARWAAGEFGDDVDYWVTINEPFVQVLDGWIGATNPPGKISEVQEALAAAENMMWAHARAYDAIHEVDVDDADGDGQSAWVSIAKHQRVFLPKDPRDDEHIRAAQMLGYLLNTLFLQAVVYGNLDRNYDFDYDDPTDLAGEPLLMGRLDYIGLNYYGPTLVIETANENNFPLIGIPFLNDLDLKGFDGPLSDFGWTIYPDGLRVVLDELQPYGLPIIITGNGVADARGTLRPRFLIEHLYELNRAVDDGHDIRGYFHWSLMDNFEWGSGYCPRFGLFRVDFESENKTRIMGEGAEVYRRIIQDNTVSPALFSDYSYGNPEFCPRSGL